MTTLIYHMCHTDEWRAAVADGCYRGSSQDRQDGFIHFSTAQQVQESAARHRAGQDHIILLAVHVHAVEPALKWESSRRGLLFPHLYGTLPLHAVAWAQDLPLDPVSGLHVFPNLKD